MDNKLLFPDYFVDDLISAYAWQVLSSREQIEALAEKIPNEPRSTVYRSALTEQIHDNEKNRYNSWGS